MTPHLWASYRLNFALEMTGPPTPPAHKLPPGTAISALLVSCHMLGDWAILGSGMLGADLAVDPC